MKKHFYCISDIKKNSTMTWHSTLALSARGSDARALSITGYGEVA
jgi:hypothetical protein